MRALRFVTFGHRLQRHDIGGRAVMRFGSAASAACAVAALTWSVPGLAQVTEGERVVARQLFREGDDLQRAGKLDEALDRFQRAESAYSAPTNVLRIAECQAALGQLVESAESYRKALRMPMPADSPQAFRSAVDQAKGELAQVEPRVPKLVVLVSPAGTPAPEIRIDGQVVSSALIGEPIPLDPGVHTVRVVARGFVSVEQEALLKERESTTVNVVFRPLASPPLPAPLPPPPQLAPLPATPAPATQASATPPSAPPPYEPPPPPPLDANRRMSFARGPSRTGLILGGHVGWDFGGGQLPLDDATAVDTNTVAAGGLAYGADGGLRFARHWYVGLTLEHAELGHGDLSSLQDVSDASASTTLLGVVVGYIGNPDRPSFYGELGAANRWVNLTETTSTGDLSWSYSSGELTLGLGLWLPVGPSVRLLPEVTLGLGTFDPPGGSDSTGAEGHTFVMVGMAGFYNIDF
jgi:hypothetical protein